MGSTAKLLVTEPGAIAGKPFVKVSGAAATGDVGGGDRKGRLESEILNDVGVLREIVVDAVAGAHHGLLQRTPGDADARSVVVAVADESAKPDMRR